MKDNNNHVEVMLFSKAIANQWSHRDIVKWFTTSVLPVLELQEIYARKLFPGTLRHILPIYLS